MDAEMDGGRDGLMDRGRNGWMDTRTLLTRWMDVGMERIEEWMDSWMEGRMYRQRVGGWMDAEMSGWTDGWVGR